jgi:MFS family permease
VLLYPVYAVLFAHAGLSAAAISSLFVIWSLTGFLLEVPTGALADRVSRRLLLTTAPVLAGAGFALWTFLPGYWSFALGFVVWGAGDALRSGTLQAAVYTELDRVGAAGAYERLTGRAGAFSTVAIMVASGLAVPVLAAGGFRAVGVASVVATLLAAVAGAAFPDHRDGRPEPEGRYLDTLRSGLAELRAAAPVRRSLALVALLLGLGALEEYLPLLARSTHVGTTAVPLLVLMVTAGETVGGWCAGRGRRWAVPVLTLGAACLAVGAASGHPAGLVLVAAASGAFRWASVGAEARLQDRIGDGARATTTSMAALAAEVVALLTFAGYALGATWLGPGALFALAALPYLLAALLW